MREGVSTTRILWLICIATLFSVDSTSINPAWDQVSGEHRSSKECRRTVMQLDQSQGYVESET